MIFETEKLSFSAPAAIIVPAVCAHAFRFTPHVTNGWVLTFTEDAVLNGESLASLCAFGGQPIVPIPDRDEGAYLSLLCANLSREFSLARDGRRLAMRALLALVAVSLLRLGSRRTVAGGGASHLASETVRKLRSLVDEHFRKTRSLGFYAGKLAMTTDRLNDHVKHAAGNSAGHLIRQRVLAETKSRLMFSAQSIRSIAEDLGFADSSHLSRFFRKYTGMTPHDFRQRRGD